MPDSVDRSEIYQVEGNVLKRLALLIMCVAVLTGCGKLGPYFRVFQGAKAYANGDYQQANISYIEARTEDYGHWIAYNLGAVYYALGEIDAAESEWFVAQGAPDNELAYRVLYNYGVLLYERGEYARAYEKFRNALEINPSGLEAKINLELTIEKLEISEGSPEAAVSSQQDEQMSGEIDLIMNYLKKMEGAVWQSTEELEYKPLPRDL